MFNKKLSVWKKIKTDNIKYNPDFSKTVGNRFRIDVNIHEDKDGKICLFFDLIQDNDIELYHIEEVEVDDYFDVIQGLEFIVYDISSKIVTKVDEELNKNDGFIDCDYEWFMSHLSRVRRK